MPRSAESSPQPCRPSSARVEKHPDPPRGARTARLRSGPCCEGAAAAALSRTRRVARISKRSP
eukprot:5619095-Lingulodinium_polyedra.AAC.1